MKRRIGIFTLFVAVLAAAGLLLAQDNPFVGTWKLNVAKSKYDPGPAPQSQMRTWEASGTVTAKGIGATGNPTAYSYPINGDGKKYPTNGPVPNGADTVSTKRVDANTFMANFTKAGKHVETATFKLSKDGKTMTITAKGVLPSGQSLNNSTLWEKQ